jgi:hypothetical protein
MWRFRKLAEHFERSAAPGNLDTTVVTKVARITMIAKPASSSTKVRPLDLLCGKSMGKNTNSAPVAKRGVRIMLLDISKKISSQR